jgi:deazaflavin-dependent oxidoreductase (nitroreductase family)
MTIEDIEQRAIDNPQPWARAHVEQYLDTDGAEVDHPLSDNLILLYTRGRRSGEIRRVPVVHHPDGDDLIVIASKGGAPQHPDWFFNLRSDPRVWVRRKSEVFEATASILEGDEHDEMWSRITEWAPGFQRYQERTERQIPLVRLRAVEP